MINSQDFKSWVKRPATLTSLDKTDLSLFCLFLSPPNSLVIWDQLKHIF
jgi:hypothetical protein